MTEQEQSCLTLSFPLKVGVTWREKVLQEEVIPRGKELQVEQKPHPLILVGMNHLFSHFSYATRLDYFFVFIDTVPGLAFSMPVDPGTVRGKRM